MEVLTLTLALLIAEAAALAVGWWLGRSSRGPVTLHDLQQMERNIMAAFEDLKVVLGEINGTTNEIATDIDELIAKLSQPGGLTEAQAQEIVTDLRGHSETLKAVASKYPPPTPPPA